jgi:hypothetical protein
MLVLDGLIVAEKKFVSSPIGKAEEKKRLAGSC